MITMTPLELFALLFISTITTGVIAALISSGKDKAE